jgi:hypothetical protein
MTKTISLQVYLKGGGDDVVAVPEALLFRLARNIQEKGCETLHLASGKTFEITGFMVTGSDFRKESRIIVVEGEPK